MSTTTDTDDTDRTDTEPTVESICEALDLDPERVLDTPTPEERVSMRMARDARKRSYTTMPTTRVLPNGERVSLYQVVYEHVSTDNPLADDETVRWVVTDLCDGITMRNPPSWSRKRTVDPETFCANYEVAWTVDGHAVRGY